MGGDRYVSGGVNWSAFTLQELVGMVGDKESVPQLERLADDWRRTGEGMVDAADYLADALDDLMDFWSGESADQARNAVALNAQWVGDLGTTAKSMADPIEETAGALKAAQEAMPKLPEVPPQQQPGSAPAGADEAARATGGSQLGAAVGATAAGSGSAFQSQAEQDEMKQVAVETMQRFETAALGIDVTTPQFQEQSNELRPRIDEPKPKPVPVENPPVDPVDAVTGVDARWQALTGMTDASTATHSGGSFESRGGFAGGGTVDVGGSGGGVGVAPGPVAGRSTLGDVVERTGGRVGMPAAASASPTSPSTPGMTGPIGGAPMGGMGAGAQAGGQDHRRRVPYDADDPFETGEKASKPVIGL